MTRAFLVILDGVGCGGATHRGTGCMKAYLATLLVVMFASQATAQSLVCQVVGLDYAVLVPEKISSQIKFRDNIQTQLTPDIRWEGGSCSFYRHVGGPKGFIGFATTISIIVNPSTRGTNGNSPIGSVVLPNAKSVDGHSVVAGWIYYEGGTRRYTANVISRKELGVVLDASCVVYNEATVSYAEIEEMSKALSDTVIPEVPLCPNHP